MSGVDETRRERTMVTIPDPSVNVRGLALPLFWSGAALIGAAVALGLSVMESARKVGGSIDALAAQEKRFADFYEPVPDDGGPRPKATGVFRDMRNGHDGFSSMPLRRVTPYNPGAPLHGAYQRMEAGEGISVNGWSAVVVLEAESGKPALLIEEPNSFPLPPPLPIDAAPNLPPVDESAPAPAAGPKPHGPPTPEAVQDFRAAVGDTVANGAGWTWAIDLWVVTFGPRTYHVKPAPVGWDVWERIWPLDAPKAVEELPAPPKTGTPPADSVEELFRDKSA